MSKVREMKYLIEDMGVRLDEQTYAFLDKYAGFEGVLGNAYVYFPSVKEIVEFNSRYENLKPFEKAFFIGSDLENTLFGADYRDGVRFFSLPFNGGDSQLTYLGNNCSELMKRIKNLDF